MAGWSKVLLSGDAAELGTATPLAVAAAGDAGTGSAASKEDHVHSIGTGTVGAVQLAADCVGAAAIDGTATDMAFAQIVLTPTASGAGTTEGSLMYDSDDNHLYVYVV